MDMNSLLNFNYSTRPGHASAYGSPDKTNTMYSRYFICGITALFLTFLCTGVRAQTIISVMDFDGTSPEMTVATDVPFFDNLSDGFFGVLDNNDDPNDGTPTDTGSGGSTNPSATIDFGNLTGDYLYVRDLEDLDGGNTNGTAGIATVTFGPVDVTGQVGVSFSFDYQLIGFENSEIAEYEVFADGVSQGIINLREGLSSGEATQGTASTCVVSGAVSVTLELRIKQNVENDFGAFDNFTVTADSGCTPECGVSISESTLSLVCEAFTAGSGDAVSGSVNYLGMEAGVTVSIDNGANITGNSDDPATQEGGTQNNARELRFAGLTEGGTYTVSISGGACTGGAAPSFTFTVPADLCQPIGDIVINEFFARRNPGVTPDNPQEFIEIYNRGTEDVDVSGYTIEEGSGERNVVPEGTVLGPEEGLTFGDMNDANGGCIFIDVFGLSLNDGGDIIILRDAGETVVHQITYDGGDLVAGVSRALSPDGNIDGGYFNHTDVSDEGNAFSPCLENIDNDVALPLTLRSFTARADAKSVRLAWETANEVVNDRFEIERSRDGNAWENIGVVTAATAGRSADHSYDFTDIRPTEGVNYYRLRQVDLDGTATLYGPVSAEINGVAFGVFPNPAGAELRLTTPLNDGDRASILSADGKLIREVTNIRGSINVAELTSGIYLLRVSQKSGTEVIRFVKR